MGPRFLDIELTGRCLLRCRHCYCGAPFRCDLPVETVAAVIAQAADYFDCLIFSGGEPFLHPHLLDLVRVAEAQGFSVHITTSGCGVSRDDLDRLPSNAVLVFGVDGIGEEHDGFRGRPGAYAELRDTMEYWERRPQEIITTLWKGAVRRLDDLADLASSRSAGVHFNALIPVGRARDNPDILPSVEEKHTARRHIEALARTHNGVLTDLHCLTQGDCRQGIDLFCKGRFSIDPQGNVHPCEFLSRVSFGNVFHEQLSAIISRAQATPFIQAREEGFKRQVHLDVADPFDYHTAICHPLAARLHG